MREAKFRLFVPGIKHDGPRDWLDTARQYVEALVAMGWSEDLLLFALPYALFDGSPWMPLRHLFIGTLAERFVNVIIGVNPLPKQHVLSGLAQRQRLSFKQQHGRRPTNEEIEGCEEPPPESDFTRLFTVGVPNIAILDGTTRKLDPIEVAVLQLYDLVLSPGINQLPVKYEVCAPLHLAARLAEFRP